MENKLMSNLPFTMLWAKPNRSIEELEGHYDPLTQKWSGLDMNSSRTWCRSSTTGIITDDPDEDKDD